jgi:hypothetical protein
LFGQLVVVRYQGDADPNNGCAKYECVADKATIFKIPVGEPLPPEALAIVAGCGANPPNH